MSDCSRRCSFVFLACLALVLAVPSSGVPVAARTVGISSAGSSALTVANLDPAQAATVVVDFYRQGGGAPIALALPMLAPHGVQNVSLDEQAPLPNGAYAAMVSSDRRIASASRSAWWSSGGAIAANSPVAGKDVALPWVVKSYDGQTSLVNIQNTDPAAQTTVEFSLRRLGSAAPTKTIQLAIMPGTSITLDLLKSEHFVDMPRGWIGTGRIRSPSPVAVSVIVDVENSQRAVYAYEGVPTDKAVARLVAPVFHSGVEVAEGMADPLYRTSSLAVMNPGDEEAEVTVTYHGYGASCAGQTYQEVAAIASGDGKVFGAGNPRFPLPHGCLGAAEIEADASAVVAVAIDMVRADSTEPVQLAGAYNALAPADWAEQVLAPTVRKSDGQRQTSSTVYAMNTGDESSEATITFFDAAGAEITGCGDDCTATIPANGVHRWLLSDIDVVPAGTVGHAVIEGERPLAATLSEDPTDWASPVVDLTMFNGVPVGGSGTGPQPFGSRPSEVQQPTLNRSYEPILLRGGAPPPTRPPSPTPTQVAPSGSLSGAGVSGLMIQNLDESHDATVVVDFYQQGGSSAVAGMAGFPPVEVVLPRIPPGSGGSVYLPAEPQLSQGAYAAVAMADRAIGLVSQLQWPETGALITHRSPEPGTELILPLVTKDYMGQTSYVTIQNTDPSAAATVTVDLMAMGELEPIETIEKTVEAGSSITMKAGGPGLLVPQRPNFLGWMRLRSETQIVGHSLVELEGTSGAAYDIAAVPAEKANARLFAPLLQHAWAAPGEERTMTTGLSVLNPGPHPVGVTLTYYGVAGDCAGQVYTEDKQVASGSSVVFYQGLSSPDGSVLPSNCAATGVVEADGGPVLAEVQQTMGAGGTAQASAAAYGAVHVEEGAKRVMLPVYRRNHFGRTTLVQVMNLGDETAEVTIEFLDSARGLLPGCGETCRATIPPKGGHAWWPASIDALPDDSFGTAQVEGDQPLAVVVADVPQEARAGDLATHLGFPLNQTSGYADRHIPLALNDAGLTTPPATPTSTPPGPGPSATLTPRTTPTLTPVPVDTREPVGRRLFIPACYKNG